MMPNNPDESELYIRLNQKSSIMTGTLFLCFNLWRGAVTWLNAKFLFWLLNFIFFLNIGGSLRSVIVGLHELIHYLSIYTDLRQLGLVKRKSACKHAKSVRIHIILRLLKNSSGHLLSIEAFYLVTAKVLVRMRRLIWTFTVRICPKTRSRTARPNCLRRVVVEGLDFDIVSFPFLDGDVPRRTSYGVYMSQLIRFARVSSGLSGFNCRGGALAAGLLRRECRCFGLRGTFSRFYRGHCVLVEECGVSLGTLLRQCLSEPEFFGDLVCG